MFTSSDTELQHRLSDALARVIVLRAELNDDATLGQRWHAVKEFQSRRLAATYADLLASDRYRAPCEFFLEELYGAKDFEQRDEEALRVVPKLAKMLPTRALETLVLAVDLDEMSERFDSGVARRVALPVTSESYAAAYRKVGSEAERERQIAAVSEIGRALDRLARIPMLSAMLHMMKAPAEMWGLSHLHHFLQRGFDAFAGMRGASEFLTTIARRESAINRRLFAGDADPFRPVDS
jgi:hypothetical protein